MRIYKKYRKRPFRNAVRRWRRRRKPMFRRKRTIRSNTGYLQIKQKVQSATFQVSPGAWPAAGIVHNIMFNLVGLPNLNSIARLFDQYRIKGVAVKFINITNPYTSGNATYDFTSSIDLDGGNIGTYSELLQCSNAKRMNAMEGRTNKTIYFQPRCANLIANSVPVQPAPVPAVPITTDDVGYQLGSRGWIDLKNTEVPHYGLKFGFNGQIPMNALSQWTVDITLYLQFRKVR